MQQLGHRVKLPPPIRSEPRNQAYFSSLIADPNPYLLIQHCLTRIELIAGGSPPTNDIRAETETALLE